MLSRFFIDRPIFASVISLLIMVAGAVAIFSLPISQFPDIAPPMVQVTASYPGADPQVVADTVAAPIEQQVNGVDKMIYMQSTSARDGSYTLKITFELGTNIDMATLPACPELATSTCFPLKTTVCACGSILINSSITA